MKKVFTLKQIVITPVSLTGNRKVIATKTLKDFEELLPASIFIRIHHARLINKNGVEKYIRGDAGRYA